MFKKNKEAKELESLYECAQTEVEEFASILYLLQQYNVESIAELIRKHPNEAYVNGIFHNYDGNRTVSEEESLILAKAYFIQELESVEEILDDIKEHDGDYDDTKRMLLGIINYCTKNIR